MRGRGVREMKIRGRRKIFFSMRMGNFIHPCSERKVCHRSELRVLSDPYTSTVRGQPQHESQGGKVCTLKKKNIQKIYKKKKKKI